MPDHDHRRLRVRHRIGGRLSALAVGVRPVERHVRRGNVMAPRAQVAATADQHDPSCQWPWMRQNVATGVSVSSGG